jgi:ATP-dependent DNA helicase DinG
VRVAQARARVAAVFGPGGDLAAAVSGYVARDSQRDMALAVFDAIVERATLVAEAGTGTGKTFAYLVPALLAGGKVLVSTGTRTLQDQVFGKDIAALKAALGLAVDVALLKGRQNYVCLHRLQRTEAEGRLGSRQEVMQLRSVARFARISATGDRAELPDVPEGSGLWPAVTSTRENCLGTECPQFDPCFVYRARRAAQAADVVVVNHHLFLADLAMRDDSIREFLPAADTVVLDEAHQLPKIASDFFGTGWSIAQVTELAVDARSAGLRHAPDGASWVALTQRIEQSLRELRLRLAESGLTAGSRTALERVPRLERLAERLAAVDTPLAALAQAVEANAGREPELDAIGPRTALLRAQVGAWKAAVDSIEARGDDAGADPDSMDADAGASGDGERDAAAPQGDASVRWIAMSAQGAQFHATPLVPGEAFARARERQPQAWILTSATLTLAGRFDQYLAEVGLPAARTVRWESPFDFRTQGLLYLPESMPSPLAADFPEQVAEIVWPAIHAAGGRAFLLCTTLRAVERCALRLRALMDRDGADLPLLVQGVATRRHLLDTFRRAGNAVLVGSVSFWEGIDVRGDALSLVAIDKLPFAPPDDPVVEARIRRLRAIGRNPFLDYQLPQAVTLLKQGVGRLIRDERDRGVLMILDDRILTKPYGRTVLNSLPPFARSRRLDDVVAFFRRPGDTNA